MKIELNVGKLLGNAGLNVEDAHLSVEADFGQIAELLANLPAIQNGVMAIGAMINTLEEQSLQRQARKDALFIAREFKGDVNRFAIDTWRNLVNNAISEGTWSHQKTMAENLASVGIPQTAINYMLAKAQQSEAEPETPPVVSEPVAAVVEDHGTGQPE